MTTIACNKEQMAADTLVTDGSLFYHTPKIFVVGNSIIGAAGDVVCTNTWLDWMKSGKSKEFKKKIKGDFEGIELNSEGIWMYTGCISPDAVLDPFYACGSGSMAALTAMRLGKTPQEAVQEVMSVSKETGGDITVYNLKDIIKPKRQRKKKIVET